MPSTSTQPVELTDAQRSALTSELFALHREADPGREQPFCFCGGDAELVEAVERMRAECERERDADEIGG
jgi:hypothetical protein